MKASRALTFAALLSLAGPTFAQAPHAHDGAAKPAASASQEAFEKLKTLAGSWAGQLTTAPRFDPVEGKFVQFSLQVTSRGHAMEHEMSVSGLPDHPLTVFYVDGDSLTLTHYCDAGNRPRMIGKLSPDGKTLEFEFVDLSGGNENGHMHHAVFTFIDDDHHTEDWTYMTPDNTPARAHFDLMRTNFEGAAAR